MEVEGQAAIVSGGGSGLGRATARALTAAGVKVAILDVNETAAAEAAHETGGLAIAADVTDAGSVEHARRCPQASWPGAHCRQLRRHRDRRTHRRTRGAAAARCVPPGDRGQPDR
jgi:NAD(P)-dependent dehydrogenase (short-subunit alcohol dehydrogenase family)